MAPSGGEEGLFFPPRYTLWVTSLSRKGVLLWDVSIVFWQVDYGLFFFFGQNHLHCTVFLSILKGNAFTGFKSQKAYRYMQGMFSSHPCLVTYPVPPTPEFSVYPSRVSYAPIINKKILIPPSYYTKSTFYTTLGILLRR